MDTRGGFSSRLGFILAAAGSAVGLGNIWGFPTQVASNGGGAFVLVYIFLTFLLAYPVLMAELIIGRAAQSNIVTALEEVSESKTNIFGTWIKKVSQGIGFWGVLTASLILSFYAIVAGWMIAFAVAPIANLLGLSYLAEWLTSFSASRNLLFCLLFYLLTMSIVQRGVRAGIERWSRRLMPLLLLIIVVLIVYVATLEGAIAGWSLYLKPDFSRVFDSSLLISAMGQAFFSLSLGVGTMLIYGSYISKKENLPKLGVAVTFVDIGIAILAGLLIIPAMFVAEHNGVQIYTTAGQLLSEDTLLFTVLPALFSTMGLAGYIVAIVFFILMTIAALTSSISMLEVPVALAVERHSVARKKATWLIGLVIFLVSVFIIYNFGELFGLVIAITTKYSEPLIGLLLCVFVGWIWRRDLLLKEIKQGFSDVETGIFWLIWPFYVRFICPLIIAVVFYNRII